MTANDESRTSISPSASDSARPDVVSGALSPRNNRWRRGAPWALGGLFSLGLLVAWSTSLEKPAAASVPLDVPHVEGDAIVFSDAYAQRIHLERAAVRKAPLTPVVWVVGTVALDPTHMAAVGTRLRGLVRTVRKFEGDVIAKGELLAEVESAELGDAQASVATTEAELHAAEINAERERQLKDKQLSTAREFEVAQTELSKYKALRHAARQRVAALGGSGDGKGIIGLGLHAIRSPISGTLIERHVSAGQSVEADLVAFRIANLDQLWVELAVFEQNLAAIRVGDAVVLSPTASPNERIEGHIAHIGALIDPDTRSANVRIAIDNRARKLRPGQAVSAEIRASLGAAHSVLLVPSDAVTVIDGQPTVFVSDSATSVRAVAVELGASNGDQQQVTKGLVEGQAVVVRGVFAIKSELFR
jgi:membrane fusion protein, heavy metal efflux system